MEALWTVVPDLQGGRGGNGGSALVNKAHFEASSLRNVCLVELFFPSCPVCSPAAAFVGCANRELKRLAAHPTNAYSFQTVRLGTSGLKSSTLSSLFRKTLFEMVTFTFILPTHKSEFPTNPSTHCNRSDSQTLTVLWPQTFSFSYMKFQQFNLNRFVYFNQKIINSSHCLSQQNVKKSKFKVRRQRSNILSQFITVSFKMNKVETEVTRLHCWFKHRFYVGADS